MKKRTVRNFSPREFCVLFGFSGFLKAPGFCERTAIKMENLKAEAFSLRKSVLDMIYSAKAGHIGGDFSVMEILVSLYGREMNISPENRDDPNRDYFVLSKGHSVESYYAVLAAKGFFPMEEVLKNYSRFNSPFIGHPNNRLPGIEMNSGSLGHGLPVCVGIAKACQMDRRPSRVYVVMGDGELAEGSVWEGVMAASHYRLGNLCATVDRNRLQISGNTEDIMHHENLGERFRAFGWNVIFAEGNDVDSLCSAYEAAKSMKGKPTVVIANTTKGCGVSFMENQAGWHHRIPTDQEYRKAVDELNQKEEAAFNE